MAEKSEKFILALKKQAQDRLVEMDGNDKLDSRVEKRGHFPGKIKFIFFRIQKIFENQKWKKRRPLVMPN